MSPFGIYVRTLRVQRNISMKTLAASVSVNVSYLSKLERGKLRAPSSELVKKISKYFRLNIDEENELIVHAEESDRNIKLPENINPKVYRVAHQFARMANCLSEHQLNLIDKLLEATPELDREEVDKMVS